MNRKQVLVMYAYAWSSNTIAAFGLLRLDLAQIRMLGLALASSILALALTLALLVYRRALSGRRSFRVLFSAVARSLRMLLRPRRWRFGGLGGLVCGGAVKSKDDRR